ncbi:MAG TPA: Hpt domain-containing protein [Sulfuricurvum sp.]|nr:MAG: hypothetical protein B7Y30_11255 [Campylobacterales bacterium 16-40-21]OZA02178.1 MAG: hypothetical protein B7X89_10560 [Sulfuricurvum sp. 17-40-25]HQS66690.1 Hpt domain-containing protein [Sulfuricurvum sp.]HQT37211.1 Hpt domain-containing protein [Sulfuricurvum sp.]
MITTEAKIQTFEEVFTKLKGMLHLSDEVMIRLNNKFFESVSLTLTQLNEAVATTDYETIEMLAHSIKGSAGSLCYAEISDITETLEKHAHAKEDYAYQERYDELLEEFKRVQECYSLWKEKKGF